MKRHSVALVLRVLLFVLVVMAPQLLAAGPTGVAEAAAVASTSSQDDNGYEVLHTFTSGADGANSRAALIRADDGNLYGTTIYGGGSTSCDTYGCGVVFRMNTDSTFYEVLHSFDGGYDGAIPAASLLQASDGYLYGTTLSGGGQGCEPRGCGTVFRISLDGSEYAVLHAFRGTDGDGLSPVSTLIQAGDGLLYGTTAGGGAVTESCSAGCGTIFRIALDGTGYTVVHQFTPGDGAFPQAGLIQASNGFLYGTTFALGGNGTSQCRYPSYVECGTVYRMSLDGIEFNILHRFSGIGDGQNPFAAQLEASDGYLYGTTGYGGPIGRCADSFGCGAVFRIDAAGTDYTVYLIPSRTVGRTPAGRLVEATDGNLYTTSTGGGTSDAGSIFRLAGGELTLVHSFPYPSAEEGFSPYAGLIQLADERLYGTTGNGGLGIPGFGVVFRLTIPE